MANYNSPNGFKVLGSEGTNTYKLGGTVAKGDLLALQAAGTAVVYVQATHVEALGIATEAGVNNDVIAVHDHPDIEVVGQCSGTYAASMIGDRVDMEGATGLMLVNEDASVIGVLKIMRHYISPGSEDVGQYSRVVCKIVRHAMSAEQTSGAGTFDSLTATGAVTAATAELGGGYASTGISTTAAGALSMAGALVVDGSATFGGGFGATGVTISAAGVIDANGAVGMDGALRVGTAGASNFTATAAGAIAAASTAAITGATTLTGGLRLGAGAAPAETLAGDKVLVATDRQFIRFSNGAAARNCDLPTHTGNTGLFFFIVNATGGANAITVRLTGAGATVASLDQGEGAFFFCDGATWGHAGLFTSMAVS